MNAPSRSNPVVDNRLTLVSVLQELTVAALDLFDPARPVDEFLDRLAARLGSSASLVVGCAIGGEPQLIGSAGLSRASRSLALRCPPGHDAKAPHGAAVWEALELPYPELETDMRRWVVPLAPDPAAEARSGEKEDSQAALIIYFDRNTELSPQYEGMVRRLATTLQTALSHRRLYARTLATAQQMEEQGRMLRELNTELERRVADRTTDLATANAELEESLAQLRGTQDQLLHAGKMAAIGTLVAGLSHELNNPVCVILAYAQTLLERVPAKDPSRRPLQAIERQAMRCGELLRALLDFSRKEPTLRERIPPAAILERVQSLTQGTAERKGLTLTVVTPESDVPSFQVCKTEIESALLNLVNNALDATPHGGTVTLAAVAASEKGEPGVAITVADTGPGIAPKLRKRIFDPFFTTKPVGQGTGLGLSIARQILDTHGGSVRLLAARNGQQGATFRVWVPLVATVSATDSQRMVAIGARE